jgi:hypothetical protein
MAHPAMSMARPLAFARRLGPAARNAKATPGPPERCQMLEPFLVSTGLVAIAEIGDRPSSWP